MNNFAKLTKAVELKSPR